MYRIVRPLLFALDAETSHHITLTGLRILERLPGFRTLLPACYARRVPELPVEVMGLRFRNPIGLAAGLDKSAQTAHALAALGFGFIELGTVTPRPQPGNPRPRLFRLPRNRALINRMGFNNPGVERFVAQLQANRPSCVVGISIGKNRDTPEARAIDDYVACLRTVHAAADYIAINVSSPNTPGLRDLQGEQALRVLLSALKDEQHALGQATGRSVPLALKIAPDLDTAALQGIAAAARECGVDAIIATNTTVSREHLQPGPYDAESGGLSGPPLKPRSAAALSALYDALQGTIPLIATGGIETGADAWHRLRAGADLIQIYTGLIYRGPRIIREIAAEISQRMQVHNTGDLQHAIDIERRKRVQ